MMAVALQKKRLTSYTMCWSRCARPGLGLRTYGPSSISEAKGKCPTWPADDALMDDGIAIRGDKHMRNSVLRSVIIAAAVLGCGGSGSEPTATTNPPPPPAQATPPTIASFLASPAKITSDQGTTLTWSVTGAQSVSIDRGIGTVTGSSVSVSPAASTTYTLTATNAAGTSATA